MNKLLFILISSTFILTDGKHMNITDPTTVKIKNNHPMSAAWSCLPVFGFCGTLLNSFVLYIGYSERQTFIKPVNAMIWSVKHFKNSYTILCMNTFDRMEALYRLLLSALSVPWRSYIMAQDVQLFSFLWTKDEECFYANIFYTFVCCLYNSSHWGFTHQVIFFTERSFSSFHYSQVLVCQGQSEAGGSRGFQVP